MYAKIRPRRSTATEWSIINPVLQEGELAVEYPDTGVGTGLCKFKIGDGRTQWNDLKYAFNAVAAEGIYGGTPSVSHDICIRSGTTDQWETADPILKLGEIVFDSTMYDDLYGKIINAKIVHNEKVNYYGDGNASEKICNILKKLD